ncbi:MAG: O-antigen ligase family protein [Bacteroidota bacterium]
MLFRRYFSDEFNYFLGIYALLMSFNSLLLFGVNASLIVFAIIAFKFSPQIKVFNVNTYAQGLAVLFFLAVCLSILDIDTATDKRGLDKAMAVIPNYLYWSLLTIMMVNMRFKVNWSQIAQTIAIGLLLTLFFYSIRKTLTVDFIKNNTPNSYSFVLVCFSAISVKAVQQKYGNVAAITLLVLLISSLLGLERRAGLFLVFTTSVAALVLNKLKGIYLIIPLLLVAIIGVVLQLEFVEQSLYNSSPRIYELIYETENISTQDQSYLTRKLMIERGLKSFSEHPWTGIGINNYSLMKIEDEGNFEGADLVLGKAQDHALSAHNSYILFLVEGGLALMIPFLCILLFNLYHFVSKYNKRTPIENAFYWSFLAMIIHIYFLSEIVNVYAWFLLAVVSSISVKYSQISLIHKNET